MKLLTPLLLASALTFSASLATPSLMAQTGPAFSDYAKPRQATVSILALSTATHNGYSGSQDVYFADVQLKDGEHQFVKLVDLYEGYGYPIRRSLLSERRVFKMSVVRQTGCDMRGSDLFLPPSGQVYDAAVPQMLQDHATELVPCFRTVHRTIKIVKK